MTALDVLHRADILLRSPLPHAWACCEYALGPYCLRCACARAKNELEEESGEEGLSILECLSGQVFESDAPLVGAVALIRAARRAAGIDVKVPLSESEACAILATARASFVSQNSGLLGNLLR
jgi:hypothetical protein